MWKRIAGLCVVLVLTSAFVVLSHDPSPELVAQRAKELGTGGSASRKAHEFLIAQEEIRFPFPTLLIGIEKAPRDRIGHSVGDDFLAAEEQAIISNLTYPSYCTSGGGLTSDEVRHCNLVDQQRDHLYKYFDEGKRTFISHIGFWADSSESRPTFLHNAYVDCDEESDRLLEQFDCTQSAYSNSWNAVDQLGPFVSDLLASGDFTHLIVTSKGWNTPQLSALKAYRDFSQELATVAKEAGDPFYPLVIGISWHSGWSWGLSDIPILKLLPKVWSYGNKAKDADEIGLSWINALLNRNVLPASGAADVPVIVIGHSFGARLLGRGAASGNLLGVAPPRLQKKSKRIDLLLTLQGAFSMNRFLEERCQGREGAPFAALPDLVSNVAMTWSAEDTTAPLANLLTGANHSGSEIGHKRARQYPDHFQFREWQKGNGWIEPDPKKQWPAGEECLEQVTSRDPIHMIDATSIVTSHGDVDNIDVARMVWRLMTE